MAAVASACFLRSCGVSKVEPHITLINKFTIDGSLVLAAVWGDACAKQLMHIAIDIQQKLRCTTTLQGISSISTTTQ